MSTLKSFQLLLNDDNGDHLAETVGLLKRAKRFECLVAFAKHSVWGDFGKALERALIRGMHARIAVGLNFYHTDPKLLLALWKLTKKYKIELYLSNPADCTFHPKIYAFKFDKGSKVVVGSANLTAGGLSNNYEASVLIDDKRDELMLSVMAHFDSLMEDKAIIAASKKRIDAYVNDHEIYKTWGQLATRRARRTALEGRNSIDALTGYLQLMKEGGVNSHFEAQMQKRRSNLRKAFAHLQTIEKWRGKSTTDFVANYEELIDLFHSGGLHRAKSKIGKQKESFISAISAIITQTSLSPKDTFSILFGHLKETNGAGINLITEILHTLDNKRFAVMNQNSVSGLRLAGYISFPGRPSKSNMDADTYQAYCTNAESVCEKLSLGDFTELDALFNYVYWQEYNGAAENENASPN
jgi:HKD family nuclease